MILKKPYAFFIKNFKLFHLLMCVLSAVLLYRTSLIFGFIKEYVKYSPNVVGKELTDTLFANWTYILILLLIIINIIIIVILIKKSKPYMYYIMNIALYVGVLVAYIISHNVIHNLEIMLVAAKTTLAVRDITNIARLLQAVSVVFYLIRATGFDIRKFDFVRDLQQLDISEEDSEEYELAVSFEANETTRKLKRVYRNIKYYYKENKFMLNICILLFLGLTGLFVYLNTTKYDKTYKQNEYISVSSFDIGIKESYVIEKSDEISLIALKLSIRSNIEQKLSLTRTPLILNSKTYYHTNSYRNDVLEYGNTYNNQNIINEFSEYILVYEVPTKEVTAPKTFKYIDNITPSKGKTKVNSIDIKLNPIIVKDEKITRKDYQLTNEVVIENNKLTISNYEIQDKYVKTYTSCITNTECYEFKEIIKPSETNNVLLKLEGNIIFENKIDNVTNLYSYINAFGTLEYTLDGNKIEQKNINQVMFAKLKDNNTYIEVSKDLLNASDIKLVFKVKNNEYAYILRGNINE